MNRAPLDLTDLANSTLKIIFNNDYSSELSQKCTREETHGHSDYGSSDVDVSQESGMFDNASDDTTDVTKDLKASVNMGKEGPVNDPVQCKVQVGIDAGQDRELLALDEGIGDGPVTHGVSLLVEQKKIHVNNGAISHSKVDIGNDAG